MWRGCWLLHPGSFLLIIKSVIYLWAHLQPRCFTINKTKEKKHFKTNIKIVTTTCSLAGSGNLYICIVNMIAEAFFPTIVQTARLQVGRFVDSVIYLKREKYDLKRELLCFLSELKDLMYNQRFPAPDWSGWVDIMTGSRLHHFHLYLLSFQNKTTANLLFFWLYVRCVHQTAHNIMYKNHYTSTFIPRIRSLCSHS